MKRLHISGSESLERRYFKHLSNLSDLSVFAFGSIRIHSNAFAEIRQLRRLELHDMSVSSLPDSLFNDLENLEVLYLKNVYLRRIDSRAFAGLSKLKTLGIINTKINLLPDTIFDDLENLENLYLEENCLRRINSRVLARLTKLKKLSLHRNKLQRIDDAAFYAMSNLESLDLSVNFLENLPVSILTLVNLRSLNLDQALKLSSFLSRLVMPSLVRMGYPFLFGEPNFSEIYKPTESNLRIMEGKLRRFMTADHKLPNVLPVIILNEMKRFIIKNLSCEALRRPLATLTPIALADDLTQCGEIISRSFDIEKMRRHTPLSLPEIDEYDNVDIFRKFVTLILGSERSGIPSLEQRIFAVSSRRYCKISQEMLTSIFSDLVHVLEINIEDMEIPCDIRPVDIPDTVKLKFKIILQHVYRILINQDIPLALIDDKLFNMCTWTNGRSHSYLEGYCNRDIFFKDIFSFGIDLGHSYEDFMFDIGTRPIDLFWKLLSDTKQYLANTLSSRIKESFVSQLRIEKCISDIIGIKYFDDFYIASRLNPHFYSCNKELIKILEFMMNYETLAFYMIRRLNTQQLRRNFRAIPQISELLAKPEFMVQAFGDDYQQAYIIDGITEITRSEMESYLKKFISAPQSLCPVEMALLEMN